MRNEDIFQLHMAQSENVRELWKVKSSLTKDINYYVRRGDDYQIKIKTKFLSLLYSAWSEAQFIQIVFTPNGFSYSEINRILNYKKKNGISQAWDLMLTDAMRKVGNTTTRGDVANRLQKLKKLTKQYISEPSELRNKIAHGEWVNALNSKITSKNETISLQLSQLDPVEIEKRFEVHQFLGYIVRDLVQSPKSGFHRNYWTNIINLEDYLEKTKTWNLETKRTKLILKPIQRNNHA